ncbi:DUF2533 family protein [Halalkalibacterium halodurans]|uniref:DUF2533 family protein n=1 Tax=Halalkalibacterium halodurans TaxID=86665 RepID=UPI002E239D82|nr:DUF2533 family protein [Halalkalibacterium halodurans]
MSVHLQIADQIKKHRQAQKQFQQMDQKREAAIEKAVSEAKQGKPFTTTAINRITEEINQLAKLYQLPTRKLVTVEMIKTYALRMQK